ncbi:MAG: hypothetical protein AAGH15_05455 [Myxococcota bacterium]
MRPPFVVALVLAAALGCGEGAGAGDLTLELGAGETAYAPLADFTELPLVAGPQGGHHVWIAMRATGLRGPSVELTVDAIPQGAGDAPRRLPVRTVFREGEDGVWERFGWPAEIPDAPCFIGEEVLVRVTLEAGGASADDERIVIPTDGPGVGGCLAD